MAYEEVVEMNKIDQVRGLLKALKNIALQGIYAETYRGLESQCASTYRKCVAMLKTVSGYEDIEMLAPELADNCTMKDVSFAVETVLSLISAAEGPVMHVGPGGFRMPEIRIPKMKMHMRRHGPRFIKVRKRRRIRDRAVEEIQDEMQEKMEEEQERFEDSMEEIENKIEELQDKLEEIQEQLEERLEEIREEYEEKLEELQEEAEED